ncbi:MAG: PspC domain-containing protein [Chitinophagaceae bacterium]|nr:PspC domain-containing protein [Chitinophagaceae bacterium]
MKKVININFQGRVVPIEETAYEILKQYTESLNRFFANEEGKEEIINDIEGRIAELFAETLKKGSTCICDDDVERVINSMGRPEDFETEDPHYNQSQNNSSTQTESNSTTFAAPRGRLYRDENDKILGGVCGGLANYLRVDASVVRIVFAILTFGGGTGFFIYLLLWIFLPSKNLKTNLTKRLYRNPDEKVIGGVSSGLAAYFNIAVWIPRLIFAFPLVLGIGNSIFHNLFWDFDPFPSVFFGSFGGSLTLIYLVLWAVIPEANTASEKLEMRGEKIDLKTIKTTIQDDLVGFKERADKYGKEITEKVNKWGDEVNATASRSGNRIGHAIGIFFKAFFLFIAGMIAFALLMTLIGTLIGGVNFFPFKNFFLDGFWENTLAWATIIGFLIVPLVGFMIWIVRRFMKVKTKFRYFGATIGVIWTIGLFSCLTLVGIVLTNFKTKSAIEETISIQQPSNGKLLLTIQKDPISFYEDHWFGMNWDRNDAPFYGLNEDSIMLRTIRVSVIQSKDENYHMKLVKFSRGKDRDKARSVASNIQFNINQTDSVIILPKGFVITKNDKFRNQQVLVIIEVPVGKKIQLDNSLDDYEWFDLNYNRRKGWNADWDSNLSNSYSWDDDVELIMGEKELINPNKKKELSEDIEDLKKELQEIENKKKKLDKKKIELLKDSISNSVALIHNENIVDNYSSSKQSNVYVSSFLLDKFSF